MEEHSNQQVTNVHHKPSKTLRKLVLVLLLSAVIFTMGLSVGRGDINLKGLSKSGQTSKASALDYTSVEEVYALLKKDFDGNLQTAQLTDGLKSGLVSAAGDPYTEYFNAKDAKAFNEQLAGSITGIGAELGSESGNIVIVSPLAGFPAELAGLKPKDIIAAVDGKSTVGMSVSSVVSKIRGQEATKVKLTIVRNGGVPFTVEITRQKIKVPSVKYQIDSGIGYMKISQFTDDTVGLAQKAAQEFKDKAVKGIVLDLRGNPGGYLTGSVNISSLWLDSGKVVVQERRGGTIIDTATASGSNPLKGIPTIVLIDEGSASASEITAGALKDNGAATLLGQKSFGKGSVQEVEHLSGGSEIKITIARWFTPGGKNIDKQGLTPDKVVVNEPAAVAAGKDPQKEQAYSMLQ